MKARIITAVWIALVLAGCTSVQVPGEPLESDQSVLVRERLDVVWAMTGLDDSVRPPATDRPPVNEFVALKGFARCMEERAWPGYRSSESSYTYNAINLAHSDDERLDWYECFAANPVNADYSLGSVRQYDFVYDYFRTRLIPCLELHGHEIDRAPSRSEFRTAWSGWSDPLFPFVWNPYFELDGYSNETPMPLYRECPPEPPGQSFYTFE